MSQSSSVYFSWLTFRVLTIWSFLRDRFNTKHEHFFQTISESSWQWQGNDWGFRKKGLPLKHQINSAPVQRVPKNAAPDELGGERKKTATSRSSQKEQLSSISTRSTSQPIFVSATTMAANARTNIQMMPEISDDELLAMAIEFEKKYPQWYPWLSDAQNMKIHKANFCFVVRNCSIVVLNLFLWSFLLCVEPCHLSLLILIYIALLLSKFISDKNASGWHKMERPDRIKTASIFILKNRCKIFIY